MPDERTIAIIDGNSLLHRAFHALPTSLALSDGRPTNAVYGFLTMLFSLVDRLAPDGVVAAFDKGRPAFRTEVLEQYKTHRPLTDPDLRAQFPMIKRVLEAMDVPVVELEGWEGDDLLGTLAERAKDAGMRALLITGDRDAMQLVDERVAVVTSRKGITELVVYGPAEVLERFGVAPELIPDYLGLKGDTSDNIPGVPGIGEKTAAKLIAEYGRLEEVLAHGDEVKGKMGENLRAHAQDALDSRTVATIRRDVPVECDLSSVTWGEWDQGRILDVLREFEFTSLMPRVNAAAVPTADGEEATGVRERLPVLAGPDATARAAEVAADPPSGWVGVATEAAAGACLIPSRECAIATGAEVLVVESGRSREVLAGLVDSARIASGDVKAVLDAACSDEPSADEPLDRADAERLFDCTVAAYLLHSGRRAYDLQMIAGEQLGTTLGIREDEGDRLAADAQTSAELVGVLRESLEADASIGVFESCEMPLIPVLSRMERVGVAIDVAALAMLADDMEARIGALKTEIFDLAGMEFVIDSPKQLGAVIFETLGLPTGKRTKTGFSTDSTVLGPLAEEYPIAGKVLEYRELAKLKSTYVDALPRLLGPDRRLHTTFNQTVAATGRLSSSNPNLQNIPVRTELGRRIRAAFVPGEGYDLIVSADYSQIELRILAHLSEDEGLIEAFTDGTDFHASTAARVFGIAPEDVTRGLRSRAKATNFGIVYGISAHGLSAQLGVEHEDAQELIDRYFAAYPGVRAYLDRTIEDARRDGYAVTMMGRRRRIPELASSNHNTRSFGERTAMNHPMQGTASDIMKLAMIEADRRLREEGLASRMLLQVHDELVFEAAADELEALTRLAVEAMSGVVELGVPLAVEVSSGPDWAAAK